MRWAPLSIPRERRIQTAVLFVWCLLMPMCLMAFAMFLFVPLLWPLTIVYLVFMVFDSAPVSGGRPLRIIRHNVVRFGVCGHRVSAR